MVHPWSPAYSQRPLAGPELEKWPDVSTMYVPCSFEVQVTSGYLLHELRGFEKLWDLVARNEDFLMGVRAEKALSTLLVCLLPGG